MAGWRTKEAQTADYIHRQDRHILTTQLHALTMTKILFSTYPTHLRKALPPFYGVAHDGMQIHKMEAAHRSLNPQGWRRHPPLSTTCAAAAVHRGGGSFREATAQYFPSPRLAHGNLLLGYLARHSRAVLETLWLQPNVLTIVSPATSLNAPA